MIKTDELIKTIRNIVLDKYVIDDIDSTEVRNLHTGDITRAEFPSRLSIFDIIIPNKTYGYTSTALALKTDNGFIIVICDISICDNNDINIENIEQTEFIFENDTLFISNIEPLERNFFAVLTPDILEVITDENNYPENRDLSDFNFKDHSDSTYGIAVRIKQKIDELVALIGTHNLIDYDGSATLRLAPAKERRVLPSLFKMISKNKLTISENWATNISLMVDLDAKTITAYHSDILTNYRIITEYIQGERIEPGSQLIIDKESFGGTYLESLICDDDRKTEMLLEALMQIHTVKNIEQILKIIKDRPDANNLITLIKNGCDITDILKHDGFYTDILPLINHEDTYNIVSYLRNKLSKDLIRFTANLLSKNSNTRHQIYYMMTNNLPVIPIIKSIYKTITKIEKRFADEPDIKTLLCDIKSSSSYTLKERLKEIYDAPDTKTRKHKITDLIFESKLSEFAQLLTHKGFIKALSNKNISTGELISKINKITETGYQSRRSYDNVFRYYSDMVDMCDQLNKAGISATIPKKLELYDIITLHDSFMTIINERKNEINKKAFETTRGDYLKYEFKDETFSAVVPEDENALYEEGIALSHCVASYTERFIKGKSAILFIRENSALDKPFYTMEINTKTNDIVQVRGKHNMSMTEDVASFVNKMKVKVLKETA